MPLSELFWRPVAPGLVGKSGLANQKISFGGPKWADSMYRRFSCLRIPMIKMRRSRDSLYRNCSLIVCVNGLVGRWLVCRYGYKIYHWLIDRLIDRSIDRLISYALFWLIDEVEMCDWFALHWSMIPGKHRLSLTYLKLYIFVFGHMKLHNLTPYRYIFVFGHMKLHNLTPDWRGGHPNENVILRRLCFPV